MPEDARLGPRHRWLLLGAAVGVVLVLDQLTKWWAVERLAPSAERPLGDTIDLVGSLRFNYAENTGMAFSKGAASGRWIARCRRAHRAAGNRLVALRGQGRRPDGRRRTWSEIRQLDRPRRPLENTGQQR